MYLHPEGPGEGWLVVVRIAVLARMWSMPLSWQIVSLDRVCFDGGDRVDLKLAAVRDDLDEGLQPSSANVALASKRSKPGMLSRLMGCITSRRWRRSYGRNIKHINSGSSREIGHI